MASRVETFDVECAAETAAASPVEVATAFPPGLVEKVWVVIPAGHAGLTGIALAVAHEPVVPRQTRKAPGESWRFIEGDNESIPFDLDNYPDSGAWSAWLFNTDAIVHRWQLRFEINELPRPLAGPGIPQVLPPGEIEGAGAGGSEPPPTEGAEPPPGAPAEPPSEPPPAEPPVSPEPAPPPVAPIEPIAPGPGGEGEGPIELGPGEEGTGEGVEGAVVEPVIGGGGKPKPKAKPKAKAKVKAPKRPAKGKKLRPPARHPPGHHVTALERRTGGKEYHPPPAPRSAGRPPAVHAAPHPPPAPHHATPPPRPRPAPAYHAPPPPPRRPPPPPPKRRR